jgi:hypothetical protein
LTTGAVVIGASIILFDPLFQGLAISLVFGAIVSDIDCSAVDLLCYERKKWESSRSLRRRDVETTKENIE